MNQVFYFLLVLACPLMMIFMMRGMHGGHERTERQHSTEPTVMDTTAQDARIAELEREVDRLRAGQRAEDSPDPAVVDELHDRIDQQLVGHRR